LVWVCTNCETENALDAPFCSVCGTTFADVIRPKVARPTRDPGMAALLSLFFPGAGHAYLGMWGQAAARAIINIWAFVVVLISALTKGQSGARTIAIVFSFVSLMLWVITAHDAYREASLQPGQVILKGRTFLYVVMGVLALLMILLFSSGLKAGS
jgi:hypothetical protein